MIYNPNSIVVRLWIDAQRRFHYGMGVSDSRSLHCDIYVRMHYFVYRSTYSSFRRFLGGVRWEFMHRYSSSWYFVFLSWRCFAGGQCWCCGMPSCSSGLGKWRFSLHFSFCLVVSTYFSCNKGVCFSYTCAFVGGVLVPLLIRVASSTPFARDPARKMYPRRLPNIASCELCCLDTHRGGTCTW
jgi:hypothetical protein